MSYGFVDFVANLVMCVVLGVLLRLAFPTARWWIFGLTALLASTFVEVVQSQLLTLRDASLLDVIANVVGTGVGVVLATSLMHRNDRMRQRSP